MPYILHNYNLISHYCHFIFNNSNIYIYKHLFEYHFIIVPLFFIIVTVYNNLTHNFEFLIAAISHYCDCISNNSNFNLTNVTIFA